MSKDVGDKGDKSKTPMPWFKKYPEAYLDGTRMLTPEERGIYEDCLCLIYKYDRELPKDDRWMSHQLHVTARVWRRVRDVLITKGKLIETATGYTNNRAMIEVQSRELQRMNKAKSAEVRENVRRTEPELPFENNKTRPQLALVATTEKAQDPPHARAILDQSESRDQKEDRSLPTVDEDGSQRRPAAIPRFVSEAALNQVRSIAPSWDRQMLLKKFIDWERTHPATGDMDKAFLGWVRSFTKGRKAS